MKVQGIVKDKTTMFRAKGGMHFIKFQIEGKREHNVVAFDTLANKILHLLRVGDRVIVSGRYSEKHRNIQAQRVMMEL
jgi:tRNA(Ile2) C34 agmatinyltransferase TiaS